MRVRSVETTEFIVYYDQNSSFMDFLTWQIEALHSDVLRTIINGDTIGTSVTRSRFGILNSEHGLDVKQIWPLDHRAVKQNCKNIRTILSIGIRSNASDRELTGKIIEKKIKRAGRYSKTEKSART